MQKEKSISRKINYWIPTILLILAGSIIFLTEDRNNGFTPGTLYSGVSVHGVTIANNLISGEYPLFMYMSKEIKDNKKYYSAYNRFPIVPFYLIGILTHPFESNIKLQLYIARQLMNLFFFLSLLVVYKLVKKVTGNNYSALIVTLLTFSSYYMLTYNNMIFNDIPALFGFVFVLYCVVIFQDSQPNKSQILFYSIFPILLGWQPYGVYVSWVIIDFITIFIKNKSLKEKANSFLKSPSVKITSFSIIAGIVILNLQLLNEWRIVGGEFIRIPTIDSALWRSGIVSVNGHTQYSWTFGWISFLTGLAMSISNMLIPFWPIFRIDLGINASIFLASVLIIHFVIKYLLEGNSFNKVFLILIFSGLFWALPMRRFFALHEFQSIFLIGFPIAFYIIILKNKKTENLRLLSIIITLAFVVSVGLSNHYKTPDSEMNNLIDQFQAIKLKIPKNSLVYFDGDREKVIKNTKWAIDFFMTNYWYANKEKAQYIISLNQNYVGEKLTKNTGYNVFKIITKP